MAAPGSLEFFLLERYFLYAYHPREKRLLRGQVAHAPYHFSTVEIGQFDTEIMLQQGIDPRREQFAHACVAADVDVRIFGLEKLPRNSAAVEGI